MKQVPWCGHAGMLSVAVWCNVVCLVFVVCLSAEHQRALSRSSFQRCPCVSGRIEICKVFAEGGKPENLEKNPRSRDGNQQQTQPTYGINTGNRTQDILVGGKCTHHECTRDPPRGVVWGWGGGGVGMFHKDTLGQNVSGVTTRAPHLAFLNWPVSLASQTYECKLIFIVMFPLCLKLISILVYTIYSTLCFVI